MANSHLEQIKGLDHGTVWKLQKFIWIATFFSFAGWLGIASFRPTMLISRPLLNLVAAAAVCLSLFINLVLAVYHRFEGHTSRSDHTFIITIGVILFFAATVGASYMIFPSVSSISGLESLSFGLFFTLAPIFLWLDLFILGLATSTFIYEDVGVLSIAVPLLGILLLGMSFGHHYTEASTHLERLEAIEISGPFAETSNYESNIRESRTDIPPVNKLNVGLTAVSHTSSNIYANIQSGTQESYRIAGECSSDSSSANFMENTLRKWKTFIGLMETEKTKLVDAKISECRPDCPTDRSSYVSSLESVIELEKARLNATVNLLNYGKVESQECRLVAR